MITGLDNMRYHICKASRIYKGWPYQGPTSNNLSAESDSLNDAIAMAQSMLDRNSVGWEVWDSQTNTMEYSTNLVIDNDK
jgi:hypothetical protein